MKGRPGLWFEAMRRRGDSDEVIAVQWMDGRSRTHRFPHSESDGVGGLYRFFSEQGLQGISLKRIGASHSVPVRQRIRHFFGACRRLQAADVRWPLREKPLAEPQFFSVHFSASEALQLEENCRSRGVNLRVYLLYHFHRYFSGWLPQSPVRGSWLIPVTMRRPEELPVYGNLTSYFLLPISTESDLQKISGEYRREIKDGAYWGTYWALLLISYLGRGAVQWISDRNARRGYFMGTFSDFGEWTFTHPVPEVQEQVWAIAPPASTQYPIGIGPIVVNGKMTVGIRINPRIESPGREVIERDLLRLKQQLLS